MTPLRQNLIRTGLHITALFSLAAPIHAAQPPPPAWVPLAKEQPAPSVSSAVSSPNSVNIAFSIPGLAASEETLPQGLHSRLRVPDSGHTSEIGKPELPVVRRLIVVPDGATLGLTWKATPQSKSLAALGLRGPLRPLQRPIPKIPGARENAPFEKDAATYAKDAWLPAAPVTLKEAGTLFGRRLVMIEVSPVSYNPAKGETRLYPQIDVTITFDGQKAAVDSPLLPSEAATLQSLTLNSDTLAATDNQPGRLLIIAPDTFTNTMAPFVSHKQNLGWTVDLFPTSISGSTTNAIQNFVKGRYTNLVTRPSALLLVGDIAQIPRFIGTQTNSGDSNKPDTDLYYTCMDGGSDWLPEFPVGRFSSQVLSTIDNIITKTISTETNTLAAWNKHAAFMAGEDNYNITEGTHNSVIADYLQPIGFTSDKLFVSTYGATPAQVSSAFNSGRSLGIYSGHGSQTQWADGPVFTASDVTALTNANRYPFIASFACLTGKFSDSECFAETWLRASNKGASAVLASSVTSLWDEDDILEKKLFEAIFSEATPSAGNAIVNAKLLFLAYFGGISETHRYFEMYNLMGDPTLLILRRTLGLIATHTPTAYLNEPYTVQLLSDAATPPCAWFIASGALPPGFSLNPTNGLIDGTSASTGTYSFTVQLTDATSSSASRQYQIPVTEHLLPPSNTTLPVAVSNRAYYTTLSARDGLPSIAWEWPTIDYTTSTNGTPWSVEGVAQDWNADDASWELSLPWAFPFFGQPQTSLWVCSNGFLDFGNGTPYYANSTASLASNRMIAPLWDDLDTSSGNIFVATNASYVAIRWSTTPYGEINPVNMKAILYRSGLIVFNYGSPTPTGLSPTIGISSGTGTNYFLAPHNGLSSIPTTTVTVFMPEYAVPGLLFSPAGVVTGLPSQLGAFSIPCRIRDSASPAETTNFNLYLTVYDSQLATTQGTPVWWLASYGFTNETFSNEDLLDRDADGMPAWQEYIAGTDPTTSVSALRLLGFYWSNSIPRLQWQSADSPLNPQPPYTIWSATNLISPDWFPITNIQGRTPPINEADIPPSATPIPTFYRITITN